MNELNKSLSPYLLQHKDNPVHWKLWNETNIESAKNKDQLLLISIGYSSCHWCHVMAHECFEDEEVAQVMNSNFVNIKIDREELPEVDAIYMNALQLMTQQGGWPLNIVALPNGYPIWGCTYLPKERWIHQLQQLYNLYKNDKEKVIEYADQLHQHLTLTNRMDIILDANNEDLSIKDLLNKWQKTFDYEHGGIDRAPKFIMPTHWHFLLNYQSQSSDLSDYIHFSLQKIIHSGINDPVDGGFYRYSTDHYWFIPHFEKMLYDQGQIISVLAHAYTQNQLPIYLQTMHATHDFVVKHWSHPSGGFYGSYDADSLAPNKESIEGYYYTITQTEWNQFNSLNKPFIQDYFKFTSENKWENKYYHIQQDHSIERLAKKHHISLNVAKDYISEALSQLANIRSIKNKPSIDTKRITSWNAMFLSGCIDLYFTNPTEEILHTINNLYNYISTKPYNSKGYLTHTDTLNDEHLPILEDYAFVIKSFLKYYQISLDDKVLVRCKQLIDECLDLFFDTEQVFFRSHIASDLHIVQTIEIEDNVIPSSNAIMADLLFLASLLWNNKYYKSIAEKMIHKVTESVEHISVYSEWFALKIKWETNFSYAICKGFSKEELHQMKCQSKDYHLYIVSFKSEIPLSKNYDIASEKEIQLCNMHSCYRRSSSIDTLFTK